MKMPFRLREMRNRFFFHIPVLNLGVVRLVFNSFSFVTLRPCRLSTFAIGCSKITFSKIHLVKLLKELILFPYYISRLVTNATLACVLEFEISP